MAEFRNGVLSVVSSVSAAIEVKSGREGTFRVRCTSTGGMTLNMTVSGPQYSSEEQGHIMEVEPVGVPERMGNDTYTATTSTISGGCDGDIYQCNASNGAAVDQLTVVELRGDHIICLRYQPQIHLQKCMFRRYFCFTNNV